MKSFKVINCTGNYNILPHDHCGNIKGFTITLDVSMLIPDWFKPLSELEKHQFRINLARSVIECEAYVKAYRIDIHTSRIIEITLCT